MTPAALCLALIVYLEARSEPFIEQAAVAFTVLNRAADPQWPADVCEVTEQRRQYARVTQPMEYDAMAYRKARAIAQAVLVGKLKDPTNGATHFHERSVSPGWTRARKLAMTGTRHDFWSE
jgi:spore germination cell wall hydrolase CwlJ-like protein